MKKYFISYNYGYGFGHVTFDSDPITKENIVEWFKKSQENIKKVLRDQGTEYTNIIILNFIEIK